MTVATAENKLRNFDRVFELTNRENSLPDANWVGRTGAASRSILTSSMLGAASLIAIPGDTATIMNTARFNGLSGSKMMVRYLKMMNPASDADRQLAIRSGLVAEGATQIASAQARLMGMDTHGPAIARRISDVSMRLSLMTQHTQAMRWAFQMEAMGAMAEHQGKAFDELPIKGMMERYGINENDWDTLRSIPAHDERGAKFLRPDDLYESGMDIAEVERISDKFMGMILSEGNFAVPTASTRAKAFLTGSTQPGTFHGEVLNSIAMFKNFPVTIMFTHINRGMQQEGMAGKMSYLAQFFIGMTVAGALGLQMKEIAKGKEPRPMGLDGDTQQALKFWGSASLMGGGMGILGDFIFSDLNRYGGGLKETLAGPQIKTISDAIELTVGNTMQLAKGEDTNAVPEVIRFARSVTPFSSNWWSRAIIDRNVWDQLEKEFDPNAYTRWRRQQRKMKKSTARSSGGTAATGCPMK